MNINLNFIKTGLVAFLMLTVTQSYATVLDYPITRITDKIHVIYGPLDLPDNKNMGYRNNAVIVLTSRGAVVFDPGGSYSGGEMVVKKTKSLTDKPIVAVFNSHAHGDHWLGNEAVKKAYPNVIIYGHKNAMKKINGSNGVFWLETINRLTKGTANNKTVVGPDRAVEDGATIKIGDITFRIYHTGAAHTDGDIMIEVEEQKVVFLGDVVRNRFLGIMDSDSSFKGNIAAIDFILKKHFSYYIPAHGQSGGPEMLNDYRAYLDTLYEDVKSFYAKGLLDYEMKPKIMEDLKQYENWSGYDMRIGAHISQVFLEIEADYF